MRNGVFQSMLVGAQVITKYDLMSTSFEIMLMFKERWVCAA